jgi:hypothetical protein
VKLKFTSTANNLNFPQEFSNLNSVLNGSWEEAIYSFKAANEVRLKQGRNLKVGKQADLNNVLEERLIAAGWNGSEGRFFQSANWLRYSFRHSMSLGSDFLDAFRMHKIEKFEKIALIYASEKLLKEIWPGGGGALCSFEKAESYWSQFENILKMPLWLGKLEI